MRWIGLVAFGMPLLTHAITPEEVRALDQQAAAVRQQQSQRVSPGQAADQVLPSTAPTRATKYAQSADASAAPVAGAEAESKPGPSSSLHAPAAGSESVVIRATAPAANDAMRTAGYIVSAKKFGIPLGTWFRVRLARDVSNVESGQIEFGVVNEVVGSVRALPVGTLLFADKTYNNGSQRLDCRLTRGITPSGYEFALHGACFDLQHQAGLNGVVNVNERALVNHGVQRGAIAALRSAASRLPGASGAVAAGAGGAADSMLTDAAQVSDLNAGTPYTIYVSPQDLLIRIDETF